jgi:predicted metal-dependent HD superfamily phosphohydrolase
MPISIAQWQSTWSKLQLQAPDARLFDSVVQHYSQAHRCYHTLCHLEECFAKLEELRSEAVHAAEIELALWFHDAVYEVRRQDNEERSAEWACACLRQAGAADDVVQRVHALIMATRHHRPAADVDAQILLDVDLSILAAPAERFHEYERQIRAEYRHVPLPLFIHKREKLLEAFLSRARIFNTDTFFERYEQQARNNIVHALGRLGA